MALSNLDQQLLLIMQVGDVDPITADPILPVTAGSSGIVLQNAERLWNYYIEKMSLHPTLGPEIFGYYFKRGAIALIIAVLESRVDFSAIGTAMSVKLNQRIAARQIQSSGLLAEIIRLEQRLIASGVPRTGLIRRIEPITPPVPGESSSPLAAVGDTNIWVIDGNDPSIGGSVYWRRANAPSLVK